MSFSPFEFPLLVYKKIKKKPKISDETVAMAASALISSAAAIVYKP